MMKSKKLSRVFSQELDLQDPLRFFRKKYFLGKTNGANFALNSLGAPHRNVEIYTRAFYKHWKKYQVEGHFNHIEGIGQNHGGGFCFFREQFRNYSVQILGAKDQNETAILNDQSVVYSNVFRWLLDKQLRVGRNIVLYEKVGAFPSDEFIITETIRITRLQGIEVTMIPIPQDEEGLIDHQKLIHLIFEIGENLALVAFGSGGVHWKTGQLLNMATIGPVIEENGGKLLVNLAHAIGITKLKLHEWRVSAAVACSYKFMSGGPGGPSLLFIHKKEDTSDMLPVGWFSFDNPIETLQGETPFVKKGAQRMEASNPSVLGWIPFFASLEDYTSTSDLIYKKNTEMLKYFDELMIIIQSKFGNPIKIITPNTERATEIVFTTVDPTLATKLHKFLNENNVICDIRDNVRIRIGMFALITSFKDINLLFNKIWDFFEENK